MSIITKPTVSRGSSSTFTLNKADLAIHPMVVADSYFSNLSNWNIVKVAYKSTQGGQSEIVEFNATQATPTAPFFVTSLARDIFLVDKVIIMDFDGGMLEIPRSELSTVDFDLFFGPGGYPTLPASFTKSYPANVTSPLNIDGALLNPSLYGFNINYNVTKKMIVDQDGYQDINGYTDFNSLIYCNASQSDGKFLLGGEFTNAKGRYRLNYLIRLNSDGTTDSNFANNIVGKFNSSIQNIAIQSDGKILVCGGFSSYNGVSGRNYLVRLNQDGTVDNAFCIAAVDGSKFNAPVQSIFVQSDGKILVGGNFSGFIRRLNSDGTEDLTFNINATDGNKFNNQIRCFAVQSDGKVLVGGPFSNHGGVSGRNGFVRLNSDGTTDNDFCLNAVDNKSVSTINSFVVLPDDKIVIIGQMSGYGSNYARGVAVGLNSDGTINTQFASNVDNKFLYYYAGYTGILTSTNKIIIGGSFDSYGGITGRNRVVALNLDGTLDSVFTAAASDNNRFNTEVRSISENSSANLIISGYFTNYAGNVDRNYITVLNSSGSLLSSIADNVSSKKVKLTGTIETTAIQIDGKILMGGSFSNYSGISGLTCLMRLNADKTLDSSFNSNILSKINSTVHVIKIQANGQILIGGSFSTYGNTSSRNYLVRLNQDGTVDNDFCSNASDGSKFNSVVTCMEVQPDGKILVGGSFNNYGGVSGRSYLVRLNADGTLDESFMANAVDGQKINSVLYDVKVDSNGKILIGGAFNSYAGTSGRNHFIRLNSDGTVDSSFCANSSDSSKFGGDVRSICVQSDGKILVGGAFGYYGTNYTRRYLIRLNNDGTVDEAFCNKASDGNKLVGVVLYILIINNYIVFNNGQGYYLMNGIKVLNNDGSTALSDINYPLDFYGNYYSYAIKITPSENLAIIPLPYTDNSEITYNGVAGISYNDGNFSNSLSYLAAVGLPSTQLGQTGVYLSTNASGQLRLTNESIEGIINVNISEIESP